MKKSIFVKVSLIITVILCQADLAVAAPTWMPKYEPGRSVYVDPAMSHHLIAPYAFSSRLSERLSEKSKEGLQYYIVAAQQGDEPTPLDIPIGVAKVEELLTTWTYQPQFPKENYVVIFWVRKSHDLNKGSVGVNVGRVARASGVTKDLLDNREGFVIPALQDNMPLNPEGAMLSIVTNIEHQVKKHREAENREREAAKTRKIEVAKRAEQARIASQQRQERIKKINQNISIWLERIWHSLPMLGGVVGFGFVVFYRRQKKSTAKKLIEKWKELVDNASTFYYEIEKNELPKIKLLPLNSDSQLKAEYDSLIELLARLMVMSDAARGAVEKATSLLANNNIKRAIASVTTATIDVENLPQDVIDAELDESMNQRSKIAALDLKKCLTADWQSIKDLLKKLLEIQKFYFEMNQENAFSDCQKLCQNLLDSSITELDYYGLDRGSFNNKLYFRLNNLAEEYKDLISKSEVEFKLNRIYKSNEFSTKAETKLARLTNLINQDIADKKRCETTCQQVFTINELKRLITLATGSLTRCKTNFPNENLKYLEQTINEAISLEKDLSCQYKSQFIEAYQNRNFSNAYSLLENIERQKKVKERELKNVIKYPEKFQSKKDLLVKKYQEIKSENQALKNRYQIDLGTMLWEHENLDSISRLLSELETSLKDAQKEERRSSRSPDYSSSSSYGSYSSGSDYGSSSGGGDYGSSSGGGDY